MFRPSGPILSLLLRTTGVGRPVSTLRSRGQVGLTMWPVLLISTSWQKVESFLQMLQSTLPHARLVEARYFRGAIFGRRVGAPSLLVLSGTKVYQHGPFFCRIRAITLAILIKFGLPVIHGMPELEEMRMPLRRREGNLMVSPNMSQAGFPVELRSKMQRRSFTVKLGAIFNPSSTQEKRINPLPIGSVQPMCTVNGSKVRARNSGESIQIY